MEGPMDFHDLDGNPIVIKNLEIVRWVPKNKTDDNTAANKG